SHSPAQPWPLHSFPTRRSSDLARGRGVVDPRVRVHVLRPVGRVEAEEGQLRALAAEPLVHVVPHERAAEREGIVGDHAPPFLLKDRKSTRLNSSHVSISYAVFC